MPFWAAGTDPVSPLDVEMDVGAGRSALEVEERRGAERSALEVEEERRGAGRSALEVEERRGAGRSALEVEERRGAGRSALEEEERRGAGRSAPEVEEEEIGDPEMEEPEVRMPWEPKAPSVAERAAHYAQGHAQYRGWCRHCVLARGIGTQHRTGHEEEEEAIPTVSSDYAYMGEEQHEERLLPIVVMRDRRTKMYAASFVPRKGVEPFACKFFANFVRDLGWKRLTVKSDGEASLLALKAAAMEALPGVEAIPKESPVGDHNANAEAENAVKEVKRAFRAIKDCLEEKLGKAVRIDHPILTCLPAHAAQCLSRFRLGADGRSAEQRRTGKKWSLPVLEFGERVHVRPAVPQEPRSGMAPKMIEGRYVGHRSRTGMILIMAPIGVVRGKSFNKMSLEERWKLDGFEDLKGTPWEMVPVEPRPEREETHTASGATRGGTASSGARNTQRRR